MTGSDGRDGGGGTLYGASEQGLGGVMFSDGKVGKAH